MLEGLVFDDDAIINGGIEQELAAILAAREDDIEEVEAKAAPRTSRCTNPRSHSARHGHGLCKAVARLNIPPL